MYLTKTPAFVQSLFPNFTWRIPQADKKIYLTFDDGPIPEITEWVLELLHQYQAKATFFCVGENVKRYPQIFARINEEDHEVGNHTYHHKNGWHTRNSEYFQDIKKCAEQVDSDLFRPPYGKMTPGQIRHLQKHYSIIMWDVLTGDFDQKLGANKCFRNIIDKTTNGSILVFHDSNKAKPILTKVLPKVLEHYTQLGYTFDKIPSMGKPIN